MRRCSRCVMPETWPGITFDEKGICNICREHDKIKEIDWEKRKTYFVMEILEHYERYAAINGNKYNCMVGYSGGKDTAYTLWAMKKKYGMRPLAVTFDHGFKLSPEGEYNIQEIPKILDVDHLRFSIGNGLRNALCRRASEVMGDFCWHCHNGVGAFPTRMSKVLDIPLQIWGEPTALYGTFGAYTLDQLEEQDYEHYKKIFQAGITTDMVLPMGYNSLDLQPFIWPTNYEPKAVYLGNFEPWDQREHVRIITDELGWKHRSSDNTWVDWDKVDCPFETIRDWQKYMRRGFGKASFQASKDIRDGIITREQGLELIKKYEGKKPQEMLAFCNETGIKEEEFEKITSKRI